MNWLNWLDRQDEKLIAKALDPLARPNEITRCQRFQRAFFVFASAQLLLATLNLFSHLHTGVWTSAFGLLCNLLVVEMQTRKIQFLLLAEKLSQQPKTADSNEHATL